MSVVIPAAGPGRKLRTAGPRALLPLADGRTVLRRQVDVVRAAYPRADVVVVLGFEADRVLKTLPPFVRVVENEHFETTGTARSVLMGLRATTADRCLVMYGDLVFDREALGGLSPGRSAVLVDAVGVSPRPPGEVGATVDGRAAVHFDYGLPARWLQIAVLAGDELRLFRQAAGRPDRRRHLVHEILNDVIDRGGQLQAAQARAPVAEIDSPQDYKRVLGP